jgi:hypothetical protein
MERRSRYRPFLLFCLGIKKPGKGSDGFLWHKKQPVREITFAVESRAEEIGAGRPRQYVSVPAVIRDAHAVFENLHKLVYSQALPTSVVEPDLPELKL